MKIKLLTILLLFVGIFSSFSQSNSEEKYPLKDVIKALEKRYGISFSFADKIIENKTSPLPKSTLQLQEALRKISAATRLDFKMLNSQLVVISRKKTQIFRYQNLDEVYVQGYLTSGITKNNDGAIQLKTKKLGILPGLIEPDVLQTIKSLPGVISADETISNINIRGGTHDQNLILFDGIRMYKTGHFFGLISAFNPYLNYDITLSKSGSSSKYGESISSVIDMKLPEEIPNEFAIGAGFNLINLDVVTSIPLSATTGLQLAARRSITDFIDTPTYNQYFNRAFQDSDLSALLNNNSLLVKDENFRFHDVYGKFIWDITPDDKLQLVFLNIDNNLSYNEVLTGTIQDQELDSRLNQNNVTTGITYTRKWHDRLTTRVQKYFTYYNLSSKNADIQNQQILEQENEIQDNGLQIETAYTLNSNTSLMAGYQFSQVAISNLEHVDNPFFRRFIKQVLLTHALYGQYNYTSHNISLKAGIRANYFDKFNRFSIEPRFSFNYKFLPNFRLLATGELKSQAVSQIIDLQDDFLGIEKRRWILANNSTVPIITSKQLSLGISYKENDLLISGEVYIKDVDGITARSQGFQNQFQFMNDIGSYKIQGIDFLINKKFKNINTWLSYSYNVNNYAFNSLNNAESFPNNVDIRNVINLAGTYTYKDLKFALGVHWFTGKPFTRPVDITPLGDGIIYENPNSSRITDYLRLDTSVNYSFKIGNAKATSGLSLWSILDKRNLLNVYYDIENSSISEIENISLRITPNASFRIEF
ncbi:TonB-dependent receptor plug domain-containing protein [Tenacibaculum amylolyticum]|uniref:TonB-dependent receptor plug domain-containing protein n=1 Tax=Tenacibaculum amylolyticum TaxID=104269 RepID=UPI0038934A35